MKIKRKYSESAIQANFFKWLWNSYPHCRQLCYHIPNGGLRGAREAAALYAMGVIAGMPDMCLAIPAKGHNALYIEFKEPDANYNTEHVRNQVKVQERLKSANNMVVVCTSTEEAQDIVLDYLNGTKYLEKI
jgi:hypothetical protein